MGPVEIEKTTEELVEWERVCEISHGLFGALKDFKKDHIYVPGEESMCMIVPSSTSKRKSRPTPDHVIPIGDDILNGYREETLLKGPYAVLLVSEEAHHFFGPEGNEWKHAETPLAPMEE